MPLFTNFVPFFTELVKKNIEFFIDRETDYRLLLSKLGENGQAIEEHVEKWYDTSIKDGSFLSEK